MLNPDVFHQLSKVKNIKKKPDSTVVQRSVFL